MKRNRDLIPILVPAVFAALGILAFLTMLAPAFEPPPVTPTAVPSHTPPPTSTSTATTAPTITPTATDILPTPDFLDSPIANGYLLAPSADPDCQLPCWQGLRIGESTKEDVVRMFDELLGIREGLSISNDAYPNYISSMETISYLWELDHTIYDVIGWLRLEAMLDDETDILKGINIDTSPFDTYKIHTTQQFIGELGTPSDIYVENVSNRSIRLMLLYFEGIASLSITPVLVEEQTIDGQKKVVYNYCLDEMPIIRDVSIVEPFNDIAETSLTPLQNLWFGEYLRAARFSPIEEVFGLTVEEFVEIALDDENPCIVFE